MTEPTSTTTPGVASATSTAPASTVTPATRPTPTVHTTRTFETHDPGNRRLDRVRWPAILAGLVSALSVMLLLMVLGAAIGGTAYDAGDSLRGFGIGAGIWGVLTALISFFVGGFVAASTAAVRGKGNGTLNGALVWAVTIPVLVWLGASLAAATVRTAGNVAGTTVGAASNVAGGALGAAPDAARAADERLSNDPALAGRAEDAAADAQTRVEGTIDDTRRRLENIDRRDVERTAERVSDDVGRSAWWTLLGLLLALGAAAAGGFVGARDDHHDDDSRDRTTR